MMVSEGILTSRGGLVSHAAVVARGWGKPAVVGAESMRMAGHSFTSADVTVNEGDFISIDGTTGEVVLGEVELSAAEPPGRVRHHPQVGRRDPQGQAGRAGQRRQRSRRGQRPPVRRRGDRAVPHRAHVPGRGPPADRAPHDPGRHRRPRRRPPSRSCGWPRRPTSWRSSRPWTACRSPCACSTRRCTSSCRPTEELTLKKATDGLDGRGGEAAVGGRAVARVQPHARHPGRAPRGGQARPVRHAGAGADGGGGASGPRPRASPRSRS